MKLFYFLMLPWVLSVVSPLAARESQTSSAEIYLSPRGSDLNQGTRKSPVQTLSRAAELVGIARQNQMNDNVVVYVGDGLYQVSKPVILASAETGSSAGSVTIAAAPDAKPVFTGSRRLTKWKVLKEKVALMRLAPEVRKKVYVTDLKKAGITEWGDPLEPGNRPELFCDGSLQTLARWPDTGFVRAGLAKGKTELPRTYLKYGGTREGVFEYDEGRQNRWEQENEACLGGYWFWDWADEFQKMDRIDTVSKVFYLAEPYHHYGYKDSLRYFGVNLFCEIDQPGEWYLHREEGKLYWYPPDGVNPRKSEVTLSLCNAPYMLELRDCSGVTLRGLTFQESRGSGVLVSGGERCLLQDCRIERMGRDGIHIEGGTGHGVSGCLLRTLGYRGIDMKGGNRKTLDPAGHFVDHTVVEHFSLFKRTYEPAVHLDGCGMRVSHNRFRFSSSSAMRLEGNDFTIEYNQISHVVNESDDQGGLDIWYDPSYRGIVVRYNHWSDITGGTHSGAAGVRLDDMISGVLIYGNIFERCGSVKFGGVQIHGGKDNLVENNLFYKCHAGVSFHSWGMERWLKELDNPVLRQKISGVVDILSPIYLQKYPELKRLREDPDVNTLKNNLMVDCKNQFLRINENVQVVIHNSSAESAGKTVQEWCSPELLARYGLKPLPIQETGPKNNRWIRE